MVKKFIIIISIILFSFLTLNLYTYWSLGKGQSICRRVGDKQDFYKTLSKLEKNEDNETLGRILFMYTTFCDHMTEKDTLRVQAVLNTISNHKSK